MEGDIGNGCRIAIVGATGAVGAQVLEVLAERNFPVADLRLLASERSAGEGLDFRSEEIVVQTLDRESFRGIDLAFFCAGARQSEEFCPVAVAAGALCIDASSFWRLAPEVPLVVPEVNAAEVARGAAGGIIASPGSATTALVTALKPLHEAAGLRRIVVATYQPVSGSGRRAVDELRIQSGELLNGRPGEAKIFPHQAAFNCLPQIGSFLSGGETLEEMALVAETRKILGDPSLRMAATAVQVPVFYGDCASVNIETEHKIGAARARALLAAAPGLELIDDPGTLSYPMPVTAVGQDKVAVGRVREDGSVPAGLSLWLAADNLRKGAAINLVQIAELLSGGGDSDLKA